MADPLGVKDRRTGLFTENFEKPALRQRVLLKLRETNREISSVQQAASQLERAIQSGVKSPRSVELAKQQLRDWVLSLVESVAFIEQVLGAPVGFGMRTSIMDLQNLLARAVQTGADRGEIAEKTG